ncbi:MAG: hypothetical protein JNL21_07020 [Myxococcales bacterium]|nr:hypothetical protein [Myxococcales bacterium]
MVNSAQLLLLWMGLSVTACSFGLGSECSEPPPEVIDSRVELTQTHGGDEPRIGVPQSIMVSWHIRWSAGETGPQDLGESCVETEEQERAMSDFEIVEAECLDGACEVVSVGEMLFQQMREVRVSLNRPTATLRIRVRASSAAFEPDISDAEGVIELQAE